MTPHEAIAEVLKEHVFENDMDFDRWCARALRTLKACGYELAAIRDSKPAGFAKLADATDPLRFLKAKAQEIRGERNEP